MASTARVKCVRWRVSTVALILAACERQPSPRASRDGSSAVAPAHPVELSPQDAWSGSPGTVIATASGDDGPPILFMSDTSWLGAVDVELFGHDSYVARSVFEVGARTGSCAWQRDARLTVASDGSKPVPWSLALSPGIGWPLAVDAIGDLPPRDSSAFAILISRLASARRDDSVSAPFRGLPVVVRDAWRLQLPDGTPVAVAVAMRSMNLESNPRAEMVTIVAEPDPRSSIAGWVTAWTWRDAGPEERVEGTDLLAALELSDGHAVLVFVREGAHGLQLEFVERATPGSWRMRWNSARLSCRVPPS